MTKVMSALNKKYSVVSLLLAVMTVSLWAQQVIQNGKQFPNFRL